MSFPPYWEHAKRELCARDPVLRRVIESAPNGTLESRGDAYFTLARSIVGQQISVKAADTIWRRFESGLGEIQPEAVLAAENETLRAYGLSAAKTTYLKAIAAWFAEHGHITARWHEEEEAAIVDALTALPGIGVWTAQMFLIFHLLKPDILPIGDVGLIKAVQLHYNNGEKLITPQVLNIAENWRPWRTVATWYLWRSLEPVVVGY